MLTTQCIGRTGCVGQGLAMTTLRLVLANVVKKFHINFAPGEDGSKILEDFRDTLTGHPGKLRLSFSFRQHTYDKSSALDDSAKIL